VSIKDTGHRTAPDPDASGVGRCSVPGLGRALLSKTETILKVVHVTCIGQPRCACVQRTPLEITTGLRIITGAELPPQGWSSRCGVRLNREVFTAPTIAHVPMARSQPTSGGLFTSSLIYVGTELLGTHWTEGNPVGDAGNLVYRVVPKPNARIVVIDSHKDLLAAVDRWRHTDESMSPFRGILDLDSERNTTVDWPAAAREVDGFWLTVDGNEEAHDATNRINLITWDTEQVLWLRPTFVCGRRLPVASQERRDALRAQQQAERSAAAREAFLGALRDPDGGPAAREWVANLNPIAAGALEKLLGLDLSPDALDEAVRLPSLL